MNNLDSALDSGLSVLLENGADEVHIEMSGGNSQRISALFDEPPSVDLTGESSVMFSPYILCKTTDVEAARRGDVVHVVGRNFQVTSVKPDGRGATRIDLAETA